MTDVIQMVPIGVVHSSRTAPVDDAWDEVDAYVELDARQFTDEALIGLGDFSHAEILFVLDRIDPGQIERGTRHPRNNPNWPRVGIFAQRGRNRPNRIGATVCRILRVSGRRLYVEGLDAIDGSPVLDVKPWVAEMGPRGMVSQPEWAGELMKNYWKKR